jgi:hypothetical protein
LACIWYHFVDLCVHDVWCVSQDVKLTEGACQVILDKAGLTGWQLARSRVFLRYYHEQGLQLLLKAMEDSATLIQKIYRGYRARKMFKPLKEKRRLQTTQVASLLSQIAAHGQIHQPLLKALDRTDILEAPNRFKSRQKETAPPRTEVGPSSTDYDGLSTMQRKAKKAQKFGVKVGAVVGGADALQLALKRQKSPGNNRSRPPSEILVPSRPPSEIEGSRPSSVFEPTLEDDISRPLPPKYPPPRSKKSPPQPRGSSEDESRHSGSLTDSSPSSSPAHISAAGSREGSPAVITNRVSHKKRPPPRTAAKPPTSPRRNRRSLDPSSSSRPINISVIPNHTTSPSVPSSPVTSSSVTSSSVMAANDARSPGAANSSDVQHRRLSESILLSSSEMNMDTPLPRGKRPIGGVKSLPTDKDSSNKREAALQRISSNLESLPSGRTPHLNNGAHNPHSTRGQENTHGNTSTPASSGTSMSLRRRLLANNSDGESTLDFAHVGGSSNGRSEGHIRYISNSVPDLLEDPPTPTGPSALLLGAPPVRIEAGRVRGLASSSDVLYDSVTTMDYYGGVGAKGEGGSGFTSRSTSQYSDTSAVSGGSAVDTPPPQADKRKHKPWFGFKRSSRKKSSSGNESDKQSPMPQSPGGERRESDTGVLGFYPGLSYDSAVEMVSGQPRGTYVLFKEELQEYSGVSSVYKLGVSSGREVKMFPILCLCGQYQLVNGSPQIHPPHTSLKSLVNHYRVSELDDSITLTQPRLVAGITVSLAPSRQPQMARKRGRKKS